MVIVDILIVVVAAIYLIKGIRKGFLRTVIGLAGTVVSLIAAIFFAQSVADMLYPVLGLGDAINGLSVNMFTKLLGDNPLYTQPLGASENLLDVIGGALTQAKLPQSITDALAPKLAESVAASLVGSNAVLAEKSVIDLLAPVLTNVIMLFIAGLLTFIVIRIVVLLLSAIVKAILKSSKLLRKTDRLLGGVLGIIQATILVLVLFTFSFLLFGNAMNTAEDETGFKATINRSIQQSTAGSFIYELNPFPQLIADNINIDKIIDGIVNKETTDEESNHTEDQTGDKTAFEQERIQRTEP